MTPTARLITPAMRDFVGRESRRAPVEVDRTSIRMFARATGHTDPVFYDLEAARAAGHRDLPAPPGFLGTAVYEPDPAADLPMFGDYGEEVPESPVPLERGLNGGTELRLLEQVYAGDALTVAWTVTGFDEKQSSLGPMLLIHRRATYRRGEDVVMEMDHTHIRY